MRNGGEDRVQAQPDFAALVRTALASFSPKSA
jgi:hypothetical protein